MSKTVVGTFRDHESAERAVHALEKRGVPEKDISVVAREHGHVESGHPEGHMHNLSSGIGWGSATGGAIGLFARAGLLGSPRGGPVFAAGPLAAPFTGGAPGGLGGGVMGYGNSRGGSEKTERPG